MASICASSITSNFKFAAKVPLLMKATSSDEKPIQGFMLQEISRISKSSLPNCQSLVKFLLGRLEQNNPRIKFKALHLMKYLAINGHSEFRAYLRHNAESVKQTTNFKGELDPVHGDGLNLKVQQTALELEKLLFDVDNPEVEIIYKSMLASDESGKKMEGFGYTQAPEIKKEPSIKETLLKVRKSGSELLNKMNKSKTSFPPSEYKPTFFTPQPQYTPVDLEDSDVISTDVNDENDIASDESDGEISDDHYYERRLVENITAEGGITKIPTKDMLKDFLHKSESLEIPVILDILDERLQNPSLNVQLKSLCVLEYLLRSNLSNIPREIHKHCPSVHVLVESQDQTVQAKANKIVLAVASCLKRDKNQGASKAQVIVPPSYHEAKDLPKVQSVQDRNNKQTEQKVQINSLFTGMNISAGTRSDASDNRKLVQTSESLIDIERTPDTTLLKESDFLTMPDTRNGVLKQNSCDDDKQRNEIANVDLYSSEETPSTIAATSSGQSSSNFDLMSLGLSGGIHDFSTPGVTTNMSSCDSSLQNFDTDFLQETDKTMLSQGNDKRQIMLNPKEATGHRCEDNTIKSGVFNSNNMDSLNLRTSNTTSSSSGVNSSKNAEDLLSLNTLQQNTHPSQMLPQHSNHMFPQQTVPVLSQTPNNDLLNFQPQPRTQALPGGLVFPTNSSSAARRPFPKDMKSETDGFDFIRKSTRGDAFSFISDEIQASKAKPK